MSRFELNKPILAVGFFDKKEARGYISPDVAYVDIVARDKPIDEIGIHIVSITPTDEHKVPLEWDRTETALGYRGNFSSTKGIVPDDIAEMGLILTNQYPRASYGQVNTSCDYYWSLKSPEGRPILATLKEQSFPYHFECLNNTMTYLYGHLNSHPRLRLLIDAINEKMAKEFNAWDFNEEEIIEGHGIMLITYTRKAGLGIGEGCSSGPTRSLPGQAAIAENLVICDDHPDRLAVKRVVGEVDSFGCEYMHMCQQCYDEFKAHESAADTSGKCDWCKSHKQALTPHRDFEEGSCGRVYDVCGDCIDDERKRIEEENRMNDMEMDMGNWPNNEGEEDDE